MEPSPARSAASSRHSRHIAVGHASNGRNRRARSSYYGFHPLMIEAEVDSLFFLVSMKLSLFIVGLETDIAAVCEEVYDGPIGLLRIKSSSS